MTHSHEAYHDVTVVGAGWSGLVCTKYMLEEGLSVVALDKRDGLGGVWYYSENENDNTVMKSTYATSSCSVTEMSDYPMPEDKGPFLHHTDMLQYLHSYADHFNLVPHIRFNSLVSSVVKENDVWRTSVKGSSNERRVYVSKYLIVASGLVNSRNVQVKETLFKDFSGNIYHAGELKEHKQQHEGCNLLIYGGGETGSDILFEWYKHSHVTYWSVPTGQHFFRKYAKILPWRKPQVLDKVSSRLITTIAPYHYSKPGLAWICNWTTNGSLLAYQGHGIPEWRNNSSFMHFVVNKNGSVLDLIDYETVIPKAEVKECYGKKITFSDGTEANVDVIILSTGYSINHSFLEDDSKQRQFLKRYKYVFDNDDPSLAFVGFVRPVVGSIPVVSELQARWVAKVFSGSISLPSNGERVIQTKKDNAFWQDYFKNCSRRVGHLVEGYIYIDDIAKEAGIYPNYYKLFRENMYHWYVSIVSPFNSSFYRLNEIKSQKSIIARLQKQRKGTITPIHLFLILFLRLIWFDWLLRQLEKVKYKCQTSPLARKLARSAPVLFVNSIWCIPKRILFETCKTL